MKATYDISEIYFYNHISDIFSACAFRHDGAHNKVPLDCETPRTSQQYSVRGQGAPQLTRHHAMST